MKGTVYLVGSGPGDPGLLTVKAMQLIRRADVIVYDYLANPAHLKEALPSAVKVCVGRGFRHKKLSQDRIDRLIVGAAKKGKTVVRLKGGDPYLFGRGGEEALFLKRHRIPFQVVPGITSAVACAAYAGIPLTHRSLSSSVTFLTGHKANDGDLDSIPWKSIVSLGHGTIVIYMGFYNLGRIVQSLVAHGMPAKTRAAVIEWGTLPKQRSCEADLASIAALTRQKKFRAPCIIVIGKVIALRRSLNWFETLPLFGKKIVITRTREQSTTLRETLEDLGAQVVEFPAIRIESLSNFSKMDRVIRSLSTYDEIVFASVNGVRAFFDRILEIGRDARSLGKCHVTAVGPQTAAEILKYGVKPDRIPTHYETKAIVEELGRKPDALKGKRMLLVRASAATQNLEHDLKKLGARVDRLDAYRTLLPKSVPADLKSVILKGRVDAVTFTSASTAEHFVQLLGEKKARAIAKRALVASIGPVTSAALRKNGLPPGCEASVFTVDGLVKALVKKMKKMSFRDDEFS